MENENTEIKKEEKILSDELIAENLDLEPELEDLPV